MNNSIKLVLSLMLGCLLSWQAFADSLTLEQSLGKKLYSDENLSLHRNQSCATCHSLEKVKLFKQVVLPAPGFVDPVNVVTGTPVSEGSVAGLFGSLNSPSAGYALFSPEPFIDDEGLFVGGQFWNGRAANLEEQAKGPFLNPVEMAMPSRWAVISEIKENDSYVELFEEVYNFDLDAVPSYIMAPSDKNAPELVHIAYNLMADAIAAFERNRIFFKFNSKFDYVYAGLAKFSAEERRGMNLFNGKALCSQCHVMDEVTGPGGKIYPPVFTDFTYDNIGVPRNTSIPGNPPPDIGLAATTGNPEDRGKHKVMSLRNIAITPPYAHNGFFATLEEIVHFYNTRDVTAEGWAPPEITENVNVDELGNLGLSAKDEAALVAFMKTLTDNYPEWGDDPNIDEDTPSPY